MEIMAIPIPAITTQDTLVYLFCSITNWVCRREECDTMPHSFDNTWGIMKDSSLVPSVFVLFSLFICLSILTSSASPFSANVRPCITDEQEAFFHQVLKIPFDEWKCRYLITLDTLHAYSGGPKLTLAARCLNSYSHQRKFLLPSFFPSFSFCLFIQLLSFALCKKEVARQRVLV